MNELALYYPTGHQVHFELGHPERPERVEVIKTTFVESGYWQKSLLIEADILHRSIVEKIHSPSYLSLLERTARRVGHLDADTYVTSGSWELAQQTAGGAVALVRSVWRRDSATGFALTRPPGHHATYGQGMGFCLLNNIALAAEALIQCEGANRLAIVDLDLHHGNGTQDIFWQRGDVLFISTHQRPLYPGTGSVDEVGQGDGYKYTANFPMPPGSGDVAFSTVMDQAILPLLERFQPEMILISFGFDTHWSDPLGHLLLTAGGYAALITKLKQFAVDTCQGKIALILEGGYDLNAAEACSLCALKALLGHTWEDPLGPAPYRETESWQTMLSRAKTIWDL